VSLGSSTVQLHESLGSRRACACSEVRFSGQNYDRAWRLYYRRAEVCCELFCRQKDSMQRIFIKMFPVYGGKCLSRKAIQNRVQEFSQGRSKAADDARPGAEVAQTTVKRLLCCGVRRSGKDIEQMYQCWWRTCREINVLFPHLNVTYFTVYMNSWPTYWLSLLSKHHAMKTCVGVEVNLHQPRPRH
jgi:hypothetical protein